MEAEMLPELPYEVWWQILSFVDQYNLVQNVSQVNQTFHEISKCLADDEVIVSFEYPKLIDKLTKYKDFIPEDLISEELISRSKYENLRKIFGQERFRNMGCMEGAQAQVLMGQFRFLKSLHLAYSFEDAVPFLREVLEKCSTLTSLEACFFVCETETPLPTQNLTKVRLSDVGFSRNILLKCSNLRTLEAEFIDCESEELFPTQKLTSVSLRGVKNCKNVLLNCEEMETLCVVSLEHQKPDIDEIYLREVVGMNSESLENLELSNHSFKVVAEPGSVPGILSQCQKLKKVKVIGGKGSRHFSEISNRTANGLRDLSQLPNLRSLELENFSCRRPSNKIKTVFDNLGPSLEHLAIWNWFGPEKIFKEQFSMLSLKSLKVKVDSQSMLDIILDMKCEKLESLGIDVSSDEITIHVLKKLESKLECLKSLHMFTTTSTVEKIKQFFAVGQLPELQVLKVSLSESALDPTFSDEFFEEIREILEIISKSCPNLVELKLPKLLGGYLGYPFKGAILQNIA